MVLVSVTNRLEFWTLILHDDNGHRQYAHYPG